MTMLKLGKHDRRLCGDIRLDGSKSISNRVLLIRALCGEDFEIEGLSTSNDTETMSRLLAEEPEVFDCGAAGTTFRFLTAWLAFRGKPAEITGSERMLQRPVGPLVEALRALGADIAYMGEEGFPPLRIGVPDTRGNAGDISIEAGVSSQFISALLMLGPTLPEGLRLTLRGELVSRPYIEMTLGIMQYFGVGHMWVGDVIMVFPGIYTARPFAVEADWSAASYWYSLAALADEVDLTLHGLHENSLQGDAQTAGIGRQFGVETTFGEGKAHLRKSGQVPVPLFEYDFLTCPDIAQTFAVTCGALGVKGLFSGLETLPMKETDRIAAIQNELQKVQVFFSPLPLRFSKRKPKQFYMVEGAAVLPEPAPTFATYHDHRMAMSLAALAMLGEVSIEDPEVVRKSYPAFWNDLASVGFEVVTS